MTSERPQTLWSLLSDSAVFSAGRLVAALASIILVPVYTRLLTVADYGLVENVTILLNLVVGLFALALPEALIRHLPAAESDAQRRALLANCSLLSLAGGAVGLLACLAAARWFGAAVLKTPPGESLKLVATCGYLAFVTIQFTMLLSVLRITQRRRAYVLASVTALTVSLCAAVSFVVGLRLGPLGVLLGPALGTTLVYAAVAARAPGLFSLRRFDPALARRLLAFSLPLVPVSLMLLVVRSSDRYFITLLLPDALQQVGLYATAEKVLAPLSLAGVGFSMAWAPFAMHAARQDDAAQLFRAAFGHYVALTSVAVVVLAALSPLLLEVFTPPAYHASSVYVPVLAVYLALNSLHYIGSVGMLLAGQTRLGVPALGAAALLNLGLNLVLIPRFGVFGAAWATVAAFVLYDVLMFRISERLYAVGFPLARGFAAYGFSFLGASAALGRPLLAVVAVAGQLLLLLALGLLDGRAAARWLATAARERGGWLG